MTLDQRKRVFHGNIFITHGFDVGDDINLTKINESSRLVLKERSLSKYFKNYHIPLGVELPDPQQSPHCVRSQLHNFGVISLRYQIPFSGTLDELRSQINTVDDTYQKQSIKDANSLFQKIKAEITQANFFHLHNSYVILQINPQDQLDGAQVKNDYGGLIASVLRFETQSLSDFQKNEILASAFGYYRGDLIVIDTEAAFIYDDEYDDLLDICEFAGLQQLELHYFDRVLDKQLNFVYEGKIKPISWKAYLPLIGAVRDEPIGQLGRLQVDIAVITDRLENSIKLAGDPYFSELYSVLVEKLDIKMWRQSLENKLAIVNNISSVWHNELQTQRDTFLTLVIILLFLIEIVLRM